MKILALISGITAALSIFAVIMLSQHISVMQERYDHLHQQTVQACSSTGAAAKLDLSSWVPLCKDALRQ